MIARFFAQGLLVLVLVSAPFAADAATQYEIQEAQEMLNVLGYDAGSADGYMGARTRNAIRAFQSDMGMTQTGSVDLNLLNALDREVAAVSGYGGGGIDAATYGTWLEDLIFEAERTRSADRWVIDELYYVADDLASYGRGADYSGTVLNLENLVYDIDTNNSAARWVVDELYVLIDDYYLAQQPPPQVWAWPMTVLSKDFRSAGNLASAGVLLDHGNFYIDRYVGLVSQPASLNQDDGDLNGEELAIAILGALLEEAVNNNSNAKNSSDNGSGLLAQSHMTAYATNAFAMDIVVSARNATQPFVIGLFRDKLDSPGYRIAFEPGRGGEVAIILCTGNNNLEMVANAYTDIDLADGRPHSLQWTRDWYGNMELMIDGVVVIWATDTYMNDWFEGVIVQSHGGDWALESIYIADDS